MAENGTNGKASGVVEVTGKGAPTINYDFGANLSEMTSLFGEEAVYNHAMAHMIIALQNLTRSLAKQGKTAEEIKAAGEAWKPSGERRVRSERRDKALEELAAMNPEDLQNLLAEVRAKAAANAAQAS